MTDDWYCKYLPSPSMFTAYNVILNILFCSYAENCHQLQRIHCLIRSTPPWLDIYIFLTKYFGTCKCSALYWLLSCLLTICRSMKQVSLCGHLFDKFLINEALDIIETAGGSFHLVKCDVGQSIDDMSYSELEVSNKISYWCELFSVRSKHNMLSLVW